MIDPIKKLIEDLEFECKEIETMIIDRINFDPAFDDETGNLRQEFLDDPYTLEIHFSDSEADSMHCYDLGRLEALRGIIRELKQI